MIPESDPEEISWILSSGLLARFNKTQQFIRKFWCYLIFVAVLLILGVQVSIKQPKQSSPGWLEQDRRHNRLPAAYQEDIYNGTYPFLDTTLTLTARVDDLVSRLTLEEVVQQSSAVYGKPVPPIPRLGIRPWIWITECLHGQYGTNGTAFPHSIGLAASFSGSLIERVAEAIGTEVRAQWNFNTKRNKYHTYMGLVCFSPTVNIMRHPSWGRNVETYGEDPYLSSVLASSYVRGLQGNHPKYVRVGAVCKHFAAHSGPESQPLSKYSFDAIVKEEDLRMTFYPAFKACVDADSLGLMCSYNKINGVPACSNHQLLEVEARNTFNFKGFVVSDHLAIHNIYAKHKYYTNELDTVRSAIRAGCNLELTSKNFLHYIKQTDIVKNGMLSEDEVRENIKPLIMARMRLGDFDDESLNPYATIPHGVVQSSLHKELAEEAALKSFVVLKHDNGVLPLKKNYNKIAIIGAAANNSGLLYGSFAPIVDESYSVIDELKKLGTIAQYEPGCTNCVCKTFYPRKVLNATNNADLIIITVGRDNDWESRDKLEYQMAGYNLRLITTTVETAPAHATIVLLVFGGGPVDLRWADSSPRISAILMCFLPAQSTGTAILKVLTSTDSDVIPAGRLPFTWPLSFNGMPDYTDYKMHNRTYRYSSAHSLYPFGYGLSLSNFEYSNLRIIPTIVNTLDDIEIKVNVKNLGPYDAEEVIQIYLEWTNVKLPSLPRIQLVAFKRVLISMGSIKTLEFTVKYYQLKVWVDRMTGFDVLPVPMMVHVGGQQPYQKRQINSNVLTGNFNVRQRPPTAEQIPEVKEMRLSQRRQPESKNNMHNNANSFMRLNT